MARKNRIPEENARREKIRELLQMANIGSMDDIQNLFKETIAEFMEDGLEAELDDELGYSKYDYKNKNTDNSRNASLVLSNHDDFLPVDAFCFQGGRFAFSAYLRMPATETLALYQSVSTFIRMNAEPMDLPSVSRRREWVAPPPSACFMTKFIPHRLSTS